MHFLPTSRRPFRLRKQHRRPLKDDNVAISVQRDCSRLITQPQKLLRLYLPDPDQLPPQRLHHRRVSIMAAHSTPQASDLKLEHH